MNLGKHKKGQVQKWLEDEEGLVPTRSRSAHVLAAYIKLPKPGGRKFRQNLPEQAQSKPEAALVREPAPPKKAGEKHSQAASREHLLKQERLTPLRAPFAQKGKPHSAQAPVGRPGPATAPPPRQRPPRRPAP